ncbi:hypothetical protein BV898_18073 [Hypsibius exemplaris]|uniref:Retrotransposon gag domain-containing protein n=1 Tax=Hypsibius exemplaris TaxID=2072580 RepID=A0A9X6NGJ9_HYPEX|nr:hypothetical protein BV898_18073 [Hypsibius exemplaris]
MPSDNETDSGSSGNGGGAQQRQLQRPAPSLASTSTAATTQGESRSRQSQTRWLPSKVRWQLGDQSQCRNSGTRIPKKLECFSDATKWQDMPKNGRMRICWQWLPLSLEEGSGAEYWYVRTVIPGTWAELKDLMLKNFRPPTFLEYQQKALARRVMKDTESINTYFEEVMKLYDVLESLGKAFTDLKKRIN